MDYVFDTSSLIDMSKIFPDRFPTFWRNINEYVAAERIVSVREAYREVTNTSDQTLFDAWVEENKSIFHIPSPEETLFVAEIFATKNFQDLVRNKEVMKGKPVADPFIIAAAKIKGRTVVTEERYRPNSARIPNVCRHFGIPCINFHQFMENEDWRF